MAHIAEFPYLTDYYCHKIQPHFPHPESSYLAVILSRSVFPPLPFTSQPPSIWLLSPTLHRICWNFTPLEWYTFLHILEKHGNRSSCPSLTSELPVDSSSLLDSYIRFPSLDDPASQISFVFFPSIPSLLLTAFVLLLVSLPELAKISHLLFFPLILSFPVFHLLHLQSDYLYTRKINSCHSLFEYLQFFPVTNRIKFKEPS